MPARQDYRPSLDIILQGSRAARTPSHQQYAPKAYGRAEKVMEDLRRRQAQDLQRALSNVNFAPPGGGFPVAAGGSDFESFVNAIAGKESGGNYGAVNPHSGALGKYQIMPNNVRAWSRKFLGYEVSPSQFLRNPQLQERIARAQLREYYNRWGPAGAATAWYAGPGAVGTSRQYSDAPQGQYPSISDYWRDIMSRLR